ncbi:hypothetical protein [Methanolobus psychrotolerans]|uniref:hypothetical protein n=1 Tax=Methanolobus psychrotolerans TaxID=1874706 RepID=UPI000B916223|nr:hypothetical protein [Methanolobus psychrotolerans]
MGCVGELKEAFIDCLRCIETQKLVKYVRIVVQSSIIFFVALLAISSVAVGLMPWIQIMLGSDKIASSGLLSSSTTILFISITGIYVILTYSIVKESQNATNQSKVDRKIAHVEKKLEKFYNPLRRILAYELEIELVINGGYKHLTFESIKDVSSNAAPNFRVKQVDNPTLLLNDLIFYEHLATENTRSHFGKLTNHIQFENKQSRITLDELKQIMQNLEMNVPEEIEQLKRELYEMHNS